jgi:hypothetical protein
MTHLEALDTLLAHPHLWRYRQLCESEDLEQREGYRQLVVRLATGGQEPSPLPAPVAVDYGPAVAAPGRPCCGS